MIDGIRLHIGGQVAREGWTILDVNPGAHVDHVGDVRDLSFLADESCAEIYASHVLEHISYHDELQTVIRSFHRVLQPGGRLRVSVPDLEILCRLFLHPTMPARDKFEVMRMMFGGQMEPHDVHLSGLTYDFLGSFLELAGFRDINRVAGFGLFPDGSEMVFAGVPISCNIEAYK